MDPVRAKRMSAELPGIRVSGWLIKRFVNAGKSAAVFEGEKDGQRAALKIFDPELVQRFGKEAQLSRIARECSLIGESHPNLVQIFDGGECRDSNYLYVAMEFFEAPNLMETLTVLPRDKIGHIIQNVAAAVQFLESKKHAHRDIKPENIIVFPDFSRAVLLDLGVLRPFGDPGLTDEDEKIFLGTLRYSSPEFLLREEEDNINGWRAVSFYQLGAVLHDLIMRKPLFKEFSEPYAMLVEAVKSEKPVVHADDVSPDLVLLAQNCLVKSPEARLNLVSWDNFNFLPNRRGTAESARERVKKRSLNNRSKYRETSLSSHTNKNTGKLIVQHIDSIIRNECAGCDSFPPMEIKKNTKKKINVIVVFAESYDCPYRLSIRFDCELVDESTMALGIDVSACLLLSTSSKQDGRPHYSANLFRGPLDSNNLTSRIQDVLWCAVDLAQQYGNTSDLNGNEGVHWLNLIHALEEN